LKDKEIQLDQVDAEDPDLGDYNRLPDTQALSERLRSCMQVENIYSFFYHELF